MEKNFDQDIDDAFDAIMGQSLCTMALSVALMDRGVIARNDLMRTIDAFIDWASVPGRFSAAAVLQLSGLRNWLDATQGAESVTEMFSLATFGVRGKPDGRT